MIKKIIILLGLPGSGKGTQGAILSNELLIPHISTGEILRKMAAAKISESKMLNKYMKEGKLIPDDLVNKIVKKFILSDECKKGCILDGYPRSLDQAEYLSKNIDAKISTIFFEVADDVVIKRILGRYSCSTCGKLYNKYFDTSKIPGICDSCGSKEFTERSDDDKETILSRIEEYQKETLPLTNYYKQKGNFFTVNAGQSKESVSKEMSLIVKMI